jgi:hypothetical protein
MTMMYEGLLFFLLLDLPLVQMVLLLDNLRKLIMIEGGSGPLLSAISAFLALVSGDTIPVEIHPLFFGGRLQALLKKDGGLHAIAVGLSL